MTIPHNSNQSNGAMYLPIDPATGVPQGRDAAPLTQADAQLRAKYDRIIEIHQHKGNSECAVGLGIYEQSFDPSCTLELAMRSEEHTSELQSLIRNPYAV